MLNFITFRNLNSKVWILPTLRPSEIEKDFRVRARIFPRDFGNARDSSFLRNTAIPEKKSDSSSLFGTALLGPPQAEFFFEIES